MKNSELVRNLNNHGTICVEKLNFVAAEQAFQHCLKLEPNNAMVLSNLGALYWNTLDFDKAYHYNQLALQANPNYASAYGNLGLLLDAQNKFEESLNATNKAIELDPKKIDYYWDRMITYLDMDDWERGFNEYHVRFKFKSKDYSPLPYPEWEGEDLNGKTIYLQTEQGVGDRILFARFLTVLKEKYPSCRILLITEPENLPLFWEYKRLGYIDEFVPFNVPYPKADYGIYLMSIAKILNLRSNNVPANNNILENYAKHFRVKLTSLRSSPKIGICWGGNPLFVLNHWRSMPFAKICKLINDPDLTFFSFQSDGRAKEIEASGMTPMLFDLSPKIQKDGWNGTMACLRQMDLIISVDTSIAHLAGAMNVPVWNMLNTASYWPYGRFNLTTPWYPSMKLFRQKSPGDWDSVIDQVLEELEEFKHSFIKVH